MYLRKFFEEKGSEKPLPLGATATTAASGGNREAVGAAASRMRAATKQTLGAATRAASPQVTERARALTKKNKHSDSIALTRGCLSLRSGSVVTGLPSQALTRQLSQRESHWRAGQDYAGRGRLNSPRNGVPRCLGQAFPSLISRPPCQPSQRESLLQKL